MVPSARKAALRMGLTECIAGRFARGCSLSESVGIDEESLHAATGRKQNKVMAGGTPANPAMPATGFLNTQHRAGTQSDRDRHACFRVVQLQPGQRLDPVDPIAH